jgi:hypothetical protein
MDVGLILQDVNRTLWDKALGLPLRWFFSMCIKYQLLSTFSTVEAFKSPGQLVQQNIPSYRNIYKILPMDWKKVIKMSPPTSESKRWVVVALHNHGTEYYTRLLKGFRSDLSLILPDGESKLQIRVPARNMSANKIPKLGCVRLVSHHVINQEALFRLQNTYLSDRYEVQQAFQGRLRAAGYCETLNQE